MRYPSTWLCAWLVPALLAGCGGASDGTAVSSAGTAASSPGSPVSGLNSLPQPEPAAAPRWTLTDLGVLPGLTSSYATAINEDGQVVGLSYRNDSASGAGAAQRIFLYADGILRGIGPAPEQSADAAALNDARQIAGSAFIEGGAGIPDWHAFLFSGNAFTDLGTLTGSGNSHAFGLNDSGQVVGLSAAPEGHYRAFLYSNGAMRDLGTLGGADSSAAAINDAGQVAGSSATADGETHAFLYSNGLMSDLGTLESHTTSYATAINNAGEVAGASYTPGGPSSAFLYSGASMQALGTLGGPGSGATGLNDAGHVVGWSDTAHDAEPHAFLYRDGRMLDLNTLPEVAAAGWRLVYAAAINNAGQIAGRGIVNGQARAFLLSPGSAAQ